MPPLPLGPRCVELLSSLVGLTGCLPGDPEGSADVGPTGSFGAGCVDHEICRCVEGFPGVSQPLEVLHGSLSAAPGGVQGGDGPSDPPARVGARFGAHEGMKTDVADNPMPVSSAGCKRRFPLAYFACSELAHEFGNTSDGRAFAETCEFGSCMGPRRDQFPRPTAPKERPRAAPTAGVVTTDQQGIR
jgi:hypothetical protein